MEIKDFKEITEKYLPTCEKIIKQNGSCSCIDCKECPFSKLNNIFEHDCKMKYRTHGLLHNEDKKLLNSAKKYIELYNCKDIKIDEKATVENFEIKSGVKYGLMLNKEEIGLFKDELNNIMENSNMLYKVTMAKYILEKIKKVESLTTFKRGAK